MLNHVFGKYKKISIEFKDEKTCYGKLDFKSACVDWFLSIDSKHLPENSIKGEKITYRSIKIGDEELEFSTGFGDLHVESYRNILENNGFGIDENTPAIEIVESVQNYKG